MGEGGYISLFQFTKKIEGALRDPAIKFQWVTFEISSINVQRPAGHCYIDAVEKTPTGEIAAQMKATIWSSQYARIASKFRMATGTDLQRGMKILANVSASYHSRFGLSINITDIDPSFTIGESERLRRETVQRLRADGIWDMNRSLAEGVGIVSRIAVVSSPTAAGYGDFCHQIEESGYRIDVTLFDSIVQGDQAEKSIMDSLERICREEERFDAIVIIRGGGAKGDLDCFDSYGICAAIAQMPLPVITGIGHDRDISIADMVAAIPLKTPTAVAAWIVDRIRNFLMEMERATDEINNRTRHILMGLWNVLESRKSQLAGTAGWILSEKHLKMAECRTALTKAASSVAVGENARIARYDQLLRSSASGALVSESSRTGMLGQELLLRWNRIFSESDGNIARKMQSLHSFAAARIERERNITDIALQRLSGSVRLRSEKSLSKISAAEAELRSRPVSCLKFESGRLANLSMLLMSHDPKNVLGRGYALLKKNGRVMTSGSGLTPGDNVQVVLRDAVLETEIKTIK